MHSIRALLCTLVLALSVHASTAAPLSARLELLPHPERLHPSGDASLPLPQPLLVRVTLTNESPDPIHVLPWGTPLEAPPMAPFLHVSHIASGDAAPYSGPVAKRVHPAPPSLFVAVGGGASLSAVVDVAEMYALREGEHLLSLRCAVTARVGGELHVVPLSSAPLRALVAPAMARPVPRPRPSAAHGRRVAAADPTILFKKCDSSQESAVLMALNVSREDSSSASAYLLADQCDDAYVRWMGERNSHRYQLVSQNFVKIHDQLRFGNYTFDCNCHMPGTYAYVYPDDPKFTIYLCPVFWQASPNHFSFNSQPGTLTHETSHFDAVAGTRDIQYGVPGCLELAKTKPERATDNADSYEFFQESGPTCSR